MLDNTIGSLMGLDGVCREDILVLDRRAQAANEGKVTGEVGPVFTPGEVAYLLGKSAAAVQESRDVISLCEIALDRIAYGRGGCDWELQGALEKLRKVALEFVDARRGVVSGLRSAQEDEQPAAE